MDKGIVALLGVVLGFLLQSVASLVRSYTTGRRFENAVRAELEEAKELIARKIRWILRDETGVTPESRSNPSHVVACYGRLLYLGEPEDFSVHLPFWEQNIRAIVEVTPAKPFAALFREIVLVNKFVSKFRDMKLAFTSGLGDPNRMAVACLEELISIHDQLIPEHALARTLPVPSGSARFLGSHETGPGCITRRWTGAVLAFYSARVRCFGYDLCLFGDLWRLRTARSLLAFGCRL